MLTQGEGSGRLRLVGVLLAGAQDEAHRLLRQFLEADASARFSPVQWGGAPEARVLLDNLPGYPDNLMRGRDGRIWVGLAKPRNATIDKLAQSPFIRG